LDYEAGVDSLWIEAGMQYTATHGHGTEITIYCDTTIVWRVAAADLTINTLA
jgi:hypothetical protein